VGGRRKPTRGDTRPGRRDGGRPDSGGMMRKTDQTTWNLKIGGTPGFKGYDWVDDAQDVAMISRGCHASGRCRGGGFAMIGWLPAWGMFVGTTRVLS